MGKTDLPKLISYEDSRLLVALKPSGLLSVPGRGPDKQDCLISRVQADYPEALVVHRLDQGTSGLVLFARDKECQRLLGRQFEEKRVRKEYEALLLGKLAKREGLVEYFQRLDPDNRPHQIIDPLQGKSGITEWKVLEENQKGSGPLSRVRFFPRTGRTHQLRLHARELGAPIAGDALYGQGVNEEFPRLMLHAAFIEFIHPGTGERVTFSSEVPF
ncbi:MAG: RluA family pseudouridine synthase [Spirochaetales bacterium]|nr:RluA family pseudouridine synthase [Spirochaetales bacterium]